MEPIIVVGVGAVWLILALRLLVWPPSDVAGCRGAALECLLVLLACSVLVVVAGGLSWHADVQPPPAMGGAGVLSPLRTMVHADPRALWRGACIALAVGLFGWHITGGGAVVLFGGRIRERDQAYFRWCRTPLGRAYGVLMGLCGGLVIFYVGMWCYMRTHGWL